MKEEGGRRKEEEGRKEARKKSITFTRGEEKPFSKLCSNFLCQKAIFKLYGLRFVLEEI